MRGSTARTLFPNERTRKTTRGIICALLQFAKAAEIPDGIANLTDCATY